MTPNNNNKIYTKKANPNATNSELEAKVIIQNDNEKEKYNKKDNSPYDQIPNRF